MTRWSSISLTSLRASSTGWTWVRNARPKTPSNRPSIRCSMFLRTLIAGLCPRPGTLALGLERQDGARGPSGGYKRRCGDRRRREERDRDEGGTEAGDAPEAEPARERQRHGRRGEGDGLEQERRVVDEGAPE